MTPTGEEERKQFGERPDGTTNLDTNIVEKKKKKKVGGRKINSYAPERGNLGKKKGRSSGGG